MNSVAVYASGVATASLAWAVWRALREVRPVLRVTLELRVDDPADLSAVVRVVNLGKTSEEIIEYGYSGLTQPAIRDPITGVESPMTRFVVGETVEVELPPRRSRVWELRYVYDEGRDLPLIGFVKLATGETIESGPVDWPVGVPVPWTSERAFREMFPFAQPNDEAR